MSATCPVVHLSPTCSLVGQRSQLPVRSPTVSDGGDATGVEDVTGDSRRDVYSFLGVPFAQPPVGDLRFRDPVPFELWDGQRTANEFGPACPQNFKILDTIPFRVDHPAKVSEDCLYLNVWTPTKSTDAKLPVMVWIYGGGFMSGFTNIYQGDAFTTFYDVVYVTIGYRVGLPGFLCTGDDTARGNYGLLDQIEGLRWVNKYIDKFGGDPSNVTIFGNSAGGMSVSYLLMSPLARGLFKNAISHSGNGLTFATVASQEKGAAGLQLVLPLLGCTATKSEEIVAYLRSLPEEKLIIPMSLSIQMVVQPVVDGRCLLGQVEEAYVKDSIAPANYMLSCNTNEGAYMLFGAAALAGHDVSNFTTEVAHQYVKNLISGPFGSRDVSSFITAVIEEYFTGGDSSQENQKAYMELVGDALFVIPMLTTAALHSDKFSSLHNVFVYVFAQRAAYTTTPEWYGVDHAMDVAFTLGLPFINTNIPFSEVDFNLSRTLMTYLTNFAKTGNPNGEGLPKWSEYNTETKQHLVLKKDIEQSSNLKQNRVHFWNVTAKEILHKILQA